MKWERRPVVITDAERSQDDQLRSRQVRYLVMMSLRALCLVAAAVLVGAHAPLLYLWIPICLFGMVVLPWLAVIIANDRPPRARYRLVNRWRPGEPKDPPQHPLPAPEPGRVIDAEP